MKRIDDIMWVANIYGYGTGFDGNVYNVNGTSPTLRVGGGIPMTISYEEQ